MKYNPTPTATAAHNDSPNPPTPDDVGRLPAAVAVPLPLPPVAPTGEPVHCNPDIPKRTVKLESYTGQGASLEAFLAKYEEHSRYYRWNDDDRVFHLKNCLTGTAATVLWAGGTHATATQLIALLKNQHGTDNQLERFWVELYGKKRKPSESLQDLYQEIRRHISLACPNDISDMSERLAINQFTTMLDNENMRFEVLNKNPTTLETALHIALRYEALKPSLSAPQSAAATEPSKGTHMSAFIYDNKGRTKEGLRIHELHVAPDPLLDTRYAVDRARNEESTWNMIDLRRQLEDLSRWRDEQTRAQAASASGTYYTQAYTTPQYKGAYTQAPRHHTQNAGNNSKKKTRAQITQTPTADTSCFTCGGEDHWQRTCPHNSPCGKPNRGKSSQHLYKMKGAQQPRAPTPGTFCHTCGEAGHWRRSCPQTHPGQTPCITVAQERRNNVTHQLYSPE